MSTVVVSSTELLRRLREAVARSADQVQRTALDPRSSAADRDRLSARTHLLGLLLAGARIRDLGAGTEGAAYGSRVVLEDVDSGERSVHHLMRSEAMDLEMGHVSLDSPLGGALLGRTSGDVVDVRTPTATRAWRVVEVVTLPELLERLDPELPG